MKMILKTKVDKSSDNILIFTCSTNEVDFKGDRIYMKGMKFNRFLKNPIFLYNHKKDELPLGKFLSLRVEDDKLIGEVQFWINPLESSTWSEHDKKAQSIYEMYKDGFMSAVSISTFDIDYSPNKYGGDDIYECELIEISAVILPMNENALIVR